MRTAALFLIAFGLALAGAVSAQANSPRVTQGDAQAILEALGNGGWAALVNGEGVDEGAPSDLNTDSIARIAPMAAWNGRHFCSLDWHVISVAAIEGNAVGQSRTTDEIRDFLSRIIIDITLDGTHLDTETTTVKRMLNPELRGLVEAWWINEGRVMAPEDLSVGQHSLRFTGQRPGLPPMVMPPITFFIDAPGTGTCL